MNTVFVGGSRHISRLSAEVKERLKNVIKNGYDVIVGDANGADKAVQKYLFESAYENVTVFCSGEHCRNNLGKWPTQHVNPPKNVKGFQFYAAKDREMAMRADFGLMIWDGKSAGTILNVLRLARAGKISVLVNVPHKETINISNAQWESFLSQCSSDLKADLRARATPDEWEPKTITQQSSFFEALESPSAAPLPETPAPASEDDLAAVINAALAAGDPTSFIDALGTLARLRGMTQVAKDAGLARESLYRALSSGGNPEFTTVLRVMAAIGLRLEANKIHPGDMERPA
jgi:probable addiction module antidote protein